MVSELHDCCVVTASEKDIEDDQYLVPCALYEAAMVHLSAERHTEAKDLLDRAKYGNLSFTFYLDCYWFWFCLAVLQHNTAHWDTYNMNDKPFFVCSKTDGIQLNLLHGNKNKNRKSKGNKLNVKADMLRRKDTGQWSTVKHFLVPRLLNEAIGQQLDHLQQKNVRIDVPDKKH